MKFSLISEPSDELRTAVLHDAIRGDAVHTLDRYILFRLSDDVGSTLHAAGWTNNDTRRRCSPIVAYDPERNAIRTRSGSVYVLGQPKLEGNATALIVLLAVGTPSL